MDLEVQNPTAVEEFMIIENPDSSAEVLSRMTDIYRTRKILLILLSLMFTFSLLYLIFISLFCIISTHSWFCQYYYLNYEFAWALVSFIYDGLWLLTVYLYHSRGLLFFAWFSTLFLFIFGIILVISILTMLQTMMYFHLIATHILIASISSIFICIGTLTLQIIIVIYSFKLSKLISKIDNSTDC